MTAESEIIIQDIQNALDAAWLQLEDATRDLFLFNLTESQITLHVRVIIADIREEQENKEK